jgi:hypothetical protein
MVVCWGRSSKDDSVFTEERERVTETTDRQMDPESGVEEQTRELHESTCYCNCAGVCW